MNPSSQKGHEVQLLEYHKWRMSFRAAVDCSFITDDGKCEGYIELEEDCVFRKRFFILNAEEMTFEYYKENPKVVL